MTPDSVPARRYITGGRAWALPRYLIIDDSVKMGEFTRALPKAPGGEHYHKGTADTAVASAAIRPKAETIRELGFSKKQVERFETLADNKDLVEQVKTEAREAGEKYCQTS